MNRSFERRKIVNTKDLTEFAGIIDLVTVSFTDISSASFSMERSSWAPTCSHLFISRKESLPRSIQLVKRKIEKTICRSDSFAFDRLCLCVSVCVLFWKYSNNKRSSTITKQEQNYQKWRDSFPSISRRDVPIWCRSRSLLALSFFFPSPQGRTNLPRKPTSSLFFLICYSPDYQHKLEAKWMMKPKT